LIRRLQSRRQREREGLFVCEGEDVVAAALAEGVAPAFALVDAERRSAIRRAWWLRSVATSFRSAGAT
jgi:hypothetical protein